MQFVVDDLALCSPAVTLCAMHGPYLGKACVEQ